MTSPEVGDEGGIDPAPVPREVLLGILDHLPSMVGVWDRDSRNVFANRAYAGWFGLSVEELRGRHLSDLLGKENYAANAVFIEGVLAGTPQSFERPFPDSSGHVRYVRVEYTPMSLNGDVTGFIATVNDVSGRVHAEKALQDSVRQVALLEERQRIAADLHDLVIQRLFAAGLDLAAALREGPDMMQRVHAAAEGVDGGIRELRGAIHSLRELMTPTQVPASVEKILGNAGRVLGFIPTVTYSGSLEHVSPQVVQDLLAVLNEALSNIARHAEARSVEIVLACHDDQLLLRVADDGRGLGQVERSSGLSNMRERAERHGGSFVLSENQPTGTVLEWMVPTR